MLVRFPIIIIIRIFSFIKNYLDFKNIFKKIVIIFAISI